MPHTLRMVSQAIPGTSVILAFPFQVPPKPPITWLHTWARWLPWSTYQRTLRVLKQNFKSVDFDQTFRSLPALEIGSLGNSLVVQWLGVHASCWWGPGFNPGQGTKIPQDVWCGKKKKKGNHQPHEMPQTWHGQWHLRWSEGLLCSHSCERRSVINQGIGWTVWDISCPGTRRAASGRRGWRRCSWTRTTTSG